MFTKLELVAEYAKRIKELGHPNAIATGIFRVENILVSDATKNTIIVKVTASWHPTDKQLKHSSYLIDIPLNALFSRQSCGPKEISPNELVGAIIEVTNVSLHQYEWDNKQQTSVKADWHIIAFSPKVENIIEGK